MALPADIAERLARMPQPPCAKTLGLEITAFDAERREAVAIAAGRSEFCNPMGMIQGGFLCAMLDDVMAVAAVFSSGFQSVVPTLEIKVSFYEPARPGPINAVGRVAKMGKTIAFLEGELFAPDGALLAKASATARLAPVPGR